LYDLGRRCSFDEMEEEMRHSFLAKRFVTGNKASMENNG